MIIQRSYKYELDLNNAQRTACLKHAGAARWAYNFGLRRREEALAAGSASLTAIDLHRELNALKKTTIPWMYEVSKCAPQEALRDVDRAFVNYFEKRAKFPRPKKRKNGIGGFRLTGKIHISGKHVQLPRLGLLRLKEISAVQGRILSATVKEKAGRWFVSLCVEQSIVVPENQGPTVGVDIGVNRLATLSDGVVFDNHRAYRRNCKLLKRAQRILARRQQGSKRRERVKRHIGKLHHRISCIRADATHKMTTFIAKTYGEIGVEDLNVAGMLKNHRLASSISDASFGEIRRQLEYKTAWYGSKLVIRDRFYPSSKTCSLCGNINGSLKLSERMFRCVVCDYTIDRDLNAAINLRPGVPRSLDVDGKALVVDLSATKPARAKRQPNSA